MAVDSENIFCQLGHELFYISRAIDNIILLQFNIYLYDYLYHTKIATPFSKVLRQEEKASLGLKTVRMNPSRNYFL